MTLAAAVDLLITLITQAQRVSQIIARARSEGRDTLSDDDIQELEIANDQARADLEAAIETARSDL